MHNLVGKIFPTNLATVGLKNPKKSGARSTLHQDTLKQPELKNNVFLVEMLLQIRIFWGEKCEDREENQRDPKSCYIQPLYRL